MIKVRALFMFEMLTFNVARYAVEKHRQIFFIVCILSSLFFVTQCGFRFRGSVSLPSSLVISKLQDSRPPSDLAPLLRKSLVGHGITFSENESKISAIITLQNEQFKQQLLSFQSGKQNKDYQLKYSIQVGIREKDGNVLLETQTIEVTRELIFNESQYMAGASELDRLRQTMVEDGVRQILNRLRTVE